MPRPVPERQFFATDFNEELIRLERDQSRSTSMADFIGANTS